MRAPTGWTRLRFALTALVLMLAAVPARGQTVMDTLRIELVRTCAMSKASDTQLTKAVAADSTRRDAQYTELIRSRGFARGAITQCEKTRTILDRVLGTAPIGEPVDTTPAPPPPPADTTPAPPQPPPADTTPQPAMLFRSDWSTALGSSSQATQDGGKWQRAFCNNARGVVDVVSGATVGFTLTQNVLRARELTENDCLEVETTIPGTGDYYMRAYIRNDVSKRDGAVITWHPFVVNVQQPYITFWMNHGGPSGQYMWQVRGYYPSSSNNDDMQWGNLLPNATWHRFEWHVQFIGQDRFRLWPRVYTMAGQLVSDATTMRRTWTNSTQTLAQWYESGAYFRMPNMANSRKIGIGTEGPAGAGNSGQAWYYAALAVSSTGWIGAR